MNCAVLGSYAAPYPGNFIPSILALSKEMKKRNDSVVFVFPEEAKERAWISLFENEKVFFLPYAPYSLSTFKALGKIFQNEKIDLIYSHFSGWDVAARVAAPFMPCVWHCHMNVRTETFSKRFKYFLKYDIIGAFKTYSIAVSPPVGDVIEKIAGKGKSTVICNGIDFSRLQKKEDFGREKKNVLLLGWQPVVKGVDTACEAFESGLGEKTLTVSCQEATRDFFEKRYPSGLPSWLRTVEPTSDVSSLYQNADVFLSASVTEGFSCALAEAIYSGLPCVISDIEGTSWAKEFKNVFVFKTGDPESLKSALQNCFDAPMTFENAEYNRKILRKKYSLESWCSKVLEVLDSRRS